MGFIPKTAKGIVTQSINRMNPTIPIQPVKPSLIINLLKNMAKIEIYSCTLFANPEVHPYDKIIQGIAQPKPTIKMPIIQ